ncbi:MAG: hypothetical protein JST80_08055 [Bdellovibrionales bacterium]|nr:hypothetical protein [Bdellovibrionales bacterium]
MAPLRRNRKWLYPLWFAGAITLTGCSEVRTLFSVLFNGASSLSTSAFEIDEIKSGNRVTCSILGDKSVRCLGSGDKGDLGRFYGAPVTALKDVKQLAAGKGFTCAIVGDKGEVFCFGRNDKGQLGVATLPDGGAATTEPVQLMDNEGNKKEPVIDAKQLAVGDDHACAILKGGRAICWGDNSYGQAGNPEQTRFGVKTVFENERNQKAFQGIHEIFAGANSTCIIAKDDFAVYCFGERYGSTRKMNWIPEKIDLAGSIGTLSNIKQVGLGRGFGCALSKGAQVYCWGRNDLNQLGALLNLPGVTKATAVKVTYPQEQPITKVDALAVGETHACALHRDEKTLYCWGDNRFGQLGNTSVRGLPEQVALGSNNLTLKGVREVSVGPDRTCIISSRDEVFCWGNGAHGILGSEKVLSPYPVRVLDANGEMLGGAVTISVGFDHTCIVDSGSKVYCFGINDYGQLGSKFVSGAVIAADFKPITKVNAIDTFGMRTCMVYGDSQSVACFGDREIDNLNQKYENNSFVPEEMRRGMAPFKGALGVSVGRTHLCVITAEQTVECLGDGSKGQLGGGDTQSVKFATVHDEKKAILKDVWQVKTKEDWNCALKQENGAIWCWGQWKNAHWLNARQITMNGKPTADFIQIGMSEDQICGVHGVDRNVFCSTAASVGAEKIDLLPLQDFDGRPLRKILTLSGGKKHSCALDEEGRVFCWGSNEFGQLGLKTVREAPRAMKLTFAKESLHKISRISAGERHTCVASSEEPALYCFGENFFGGPNSTDPVEYPL